MVDLSNRSLLTLLDFSAEEIGYLLELAVRLKNDKYTGRERKTLQGKNIVLLFEKDSTVRDALSKWPLTIRARE